VRPALWTLANVYVAAAALCPGLPPGVLAAIAQVETSGGADRRVSTAGAIGPMQFLPGTWKVYGVDGDGDGRADPRDPVDAAYGAARLLCANGGADPHRLAAAVWNFNHSAAYVAEVLRLADGWQAATAPRRV
jgi:membrane-bound lytic murein transglycosylase B